MTIKFMKHYVTNGTIKARVSYSVSWIYAPGCNRNVQNPKTIKAVTLYAKSVLDGRALGKLMQDEYENHSDSQDDYYEEGIARIPMGHQLYELALLRCRS